MVRGDRELTLAGGGFLWAEGDEVESEDVAEDLLHLGQQRRKVAAPPVRQHCGRQAGSFQYSHT